MSMCAASERSASDPASRPATTSTPMNVRDEHKRDGQPAAVRVGPRARACGRAGPWSCACGMRRCYAAVDRGLGRRSSHRPAAQPAPGCGCAAASYRLSQSCYKVSISRYRCGASPPTRPLRAALPRGRACVGLRPLRHALLRDHPPVHGRWHRPCRVSDLRGRSDRRTRIRVPAALPRRRPGPDRGCPARSRSARRRSATPSAPSAWIVRAAASRSWSSGGSRTSPTCAAGSGSASPARWSACGCWPARSSPSA